MILGEFYLGTNKDGGIKYYSKYIQAFMTEQIVRLNWERYVVYPYIILGDIYRKEDPEKAVYFYEKAVSATKLLIKKQQLQKVLDSLIS